MNEKTYLELSEDTGNAHKFYEVIVDNTTVTIRYGRIGTDGTSSKESFSTNDEAKKYADKKLKEKMKKGYEKAVMGVRQKRQVTRRQIASKPSSAKKAPTMWSFKSGSCAFGIFITKEACWLGNEGGKVFKIDHEGKVLNQYQLPNGVKCIVSDNGWIYVGCDDGNVYDLTGKLPRLAYEISEDVDIFWLDINNGFLGVSDGGGHATVFNFEGEQLFKEKGKGDCAWMIRCDTTDNQIFYGDSAGVTCFNAVDGKKLWQKKTDDVLFGWQEKDKIYAATVDSKIHAFDKKGKELHVYQANHSLYSCATSEEGKYVFAGDSSSSLYCFKESGERLWKLASGCGSACSMQYFDGKVYVVTSDGSLTCIDASEEAIEKAQQGVVPDAREIKAPTKAMDVVETTSLETTTDTSKGVVVKCVKDGSKLRVKVETKGYKKDWFVQFPNNLRQAGAKYVVDEIKESAQGGFYRAYGNIYKLQD